MKNEEESKPDFEREEEKGGERRIEGTRGGFEERGREGVGEAGEEIERREEEGFDIESGRGGIKLRVDGGGEEQVELIEDDGGGRLNVGRGELRNKKEERKKETEGKIEEMMIRRLGTGESAESSKKEGEIKKDEGGGSRRRAMKSVVLIGNETLDAYFRKMASEKKRKEKELKSEITKTNTDLIEDFPVLNLNEELKHKWNKIKQKIHIHFGFLKARRNVELFGIDHEKSNEM